MQADAVFEGGGVKAIAFIGAVEEMEARGYKWEQLAGTSAGSLVAALLAAGYRSDELKPIFLKLNYLQFVQNRGLSRIPLIGPSCRLLFKLGLHASDELERFIEQLLQKKGIRTFGELPAGKLRIIASDITDGKMLVLPDDIAPFGIDPAAFSIAKAVRMSCSIPYFFQPVILKKGNTIHYIVDGGALSNYPIWLFDVDGIPRWPTFGFRFSEQGPNPELLKRKGVIAYSKAIITTLLSAQEQIYVKTANAVRTIFIPTLQTKITHFSINEEEKQALYESGKQAVRRFFSTWDFTAYCQQYRMPNK
ncbi:MAG: patatin-like phospholipase family protein [Clostridia bacterium]